MTGSRLWFDGEGGLSEDPRFEGGVVGGDELDLHHVLTGGEGGELLVEAVVHGDQLAVDQQVDVALIGPDASGGLGDDLGPGQAEADLGACRLRVWPLRGATMVSLAVEAGRAPRLVGAGVGVAPPLPEQAPMSRTARAARSRLVALGRWGRCCMVSTC
jgi:hypothetical protein